MFSNQRGAMTKPRICILASQYFGWGAYSGFGSMPRKLARSLAAEGVPVTVITQRRGEQRPFEQIEGVPVYSYAGLNIGEMCRLIRATDAIIFPSQNPSQTPSLAHELRNHF